MDFSVENVYSTPKDNCGHLRVTGNPYSAFNPDGKQGVAMHL